MRGIVKTTVKLRLPEETINLSDAHKRILSKLKSVEEDKGKDDSAPPTYEAMEKADFRITPKDFVKWRQSQKHHEIFTEGKAAPSMTSTTLDATTENKLRGLGADEVRNEYYQLVKSRQLKAYAKLQTSYGSLNVEIYANLAPKTAENFLELLENGYYRNTKFHRLIPGFMVPLGKQVG